jgi:hypothetical protein
LSPRERLLTVSFETNGKGYLGFIAELPGAFVRGRDKEEALSKVPREASSYLRWSTGAADPTPYRVKVAEVRRSTVDVDDADSEILIEADKKPLNRHQLAELREVAMRSGASFVGLYSEARLKDWTDPARVRKTFHGDNPKTVRETFDHVKEAHNFYLSRFKLSCDTRANFTEVRAAMLDRIEGLFERDGGSKVYEADGESWTIRKAIRRLVWHERIHGKAIVRMLEKQKQLKLIDRYADPFFFDVGRP